MRDKTDDAIAAVAAMRLGINHADALKRIAKGDWTGTRPVTLDALERKGLVAWSALAAGWVLTDHGIHVHNAIIIKEEKR